MDALEFLSAVLPSTGMYCVAEYTTKYKEQNFVSTLKEAVDLAKKYTEKKIDVYYALSSFKDGTNRTAGNTLALRSIFIDVDVGAHKESPYNTQKEAYAALAKFIDDAELPVPLIVSSGHGIHAYWRFNRDLSREEWKPAAERFKRLCKKHGLVIDNHVTGDAARVLRMPGTVNFVYPDKPVPVRVLVEDDGPLEFEPLANRLKEEINGYEYIAASTLNIPGTPPTPSATAVKMFQNTATFFKEILKKTRDGKGCNQLLHYIENASNDGMEPLWRAMLSIAKYTNDSHRAAVLLSKLHPYDENRMHTKLREIKGPYTCETIDNINLGGCDNCPNRGKVKSPIVLGREVLLDEEGEKEFVVETAEQITYTRPDPPYGFFYGKNGGVYTNASFKTSQGEMEEKTICVIPYDVFVTGSLSQDVEHNSIHVVAMQPSGVREVSIPARALVSKDDTLKALGANLVYAAGGTNNDKFLYEYIKRSASDMTVLRGPRMVPATYGWQFNKSFVIAGKEYLPDGSVITSPTGEAHANLLPITTPVGDIDVWRDIVRIFVNKERYDVLLVLLASFGAPLMQFTGYKGMLFNVQSHETGTGKSVSLGLAASVFGHPTEYMVTSDTSAVTTKLRMGNLHSLPLVMDEVTYKTRSRDTGDVDWVSQFLLDLTAGKSKERMEAMTTKERKNFVSWATIAIMSSNTSMVDALTSRNYTTNGELQRLLEIDMHTKLVLDPTEEELYSKLQFNYGLAGHKFIRWLVVNQETAKNLLAQVTKVIKERFGLRADERFWVAGLACVITAGIICSAQYAGVANFPIKEIMAVGKKLVMKSQGVVVENVRTATDVLHAFLRENYGNLLVVRKRENSLSAGLGISEGIDESITRSFVKGRIEHGFKEGFAGVFIEKAVLAQHCHRMSYNSAAFKKELSEKYTVLDNVKKNLFSHTKVKSVRVNAVCIELPEHELDDPQEVA